jgi:hypothetical protein
LLLGVELGESNDRDGALGEFGQQRIEHQTVLTLDEREDAFADGGELLARANAVDRGCLHPGGHLVAQTDDANLEELVDHVGEDRHELAALEDR